MVNQDAVRYVQRYLAVGYTPQQIQQVLMRNGYTAQEVQEIFSYMRYQNQNKVPDYHHRKFGKIIIIIILVILISGLGFWYMFNDNNTITNPPISKTTTTTQPRTTTTSYSTTTTTYYYNPTNGGDNLELFEVLLCDDIDPHFNCFENLEGEFSRENSVYIYFKIFIDGKTMSGNVSKIGFYEDREVIGPDGNVVERWTYNNVMDVSKEVDGEGLFQMPIFNELVPLEDDYPGEYKVKITIRDKYSQSKMDIETKFVLN